MLADMYGNISRIYVSTMVGIAMCFGVGLGQLLAGVVGDIMDDWRLPFLLVSLPAILLGLLMLFTIREPARGGQERAFTQKSRDTDSIVQYSERIDLSKVRWFGTKMTALFDVFFS
jgi:MFS family permease